MNIYAQPHPSEWSAILRRPTLDTQNLEEKVGAIIQDITQNGDAAIQKYTAQFDGVTLQDFKVTAQQFKTAEQSLSEELKQAIQTAKKNIEVFHATQKMPVKKVETMPGVTCWRQDVPIQKVGLYVPGGTAPLFSTVLMLGVPAVLAGCSEVVLCSPPNKEGNIHPAILYTAQLIGIDQVFAIGGVQAIGAMAIGTQSVPKVYKIFGPGNQYVTAAKQWVSRKGTAIDMPAGPSEVLVCADKTANPEFVAADLLSQAEHGADSQVVLVAFSADFITAVQESLERQLLELPRAEIARQALQNSVAIVVQNQKEAVALINEYAPEHLILSVEDAEKMAMGIYNAGSVFLGHLTPESVGDYASGTNHTLPTNGFARAYSGVSLDSFVKKITYQKLDAEGLKSLGPSVEIMAEAEELLGHKLAVSRRLAALKSE